MISATYTRYGCIYGPKGNRIYETEEGNENERPMPDALGGNFNDNNNGNRTNVGVPDEAALND